MQNYLILSVIFIGFNIAHGSPIKNPALIQFTNPKMLKYNEPLQKLQARVFAKEDPSKSLSCDLCTLAIDGLQALLKENTTEEELDHFLVEVCNALHLDTPHVCNHIVDTFAYEAYFVIERVIVEPKEICGLFIESCGTPSDWYFVNWTVPIPGGKPPVRPWPQPASSNSPKLRVLHLSDIHIDRKYAEGSEADCAVEGEIQDLILCCRDDEPTKKKGAIKMPAGPWGMPMKCDLPFKTFENAMQHIAQTERLDYIIITGDKEAHDPWDYTKELTSANIRNISDTLYRIFPTTPIYEAIGNHEGVPSDAMAPSSMEEYDKRGPQWLYAVLAETWTKYLTPLAVYQTTTRASFAIRPYPGLKLISLNTVYCSMFNFYLYINQVDPDGTLQWLIEELLDSEARGEKVHIISHIPAGSNYCLRGWSANFYEVINRFENTIAAQFYGHTHNDHFQVYYENSDPTGRATHYNWIAPSLTTESGNYPAYRIYTIDGNYEGSTWTVLDAETYFANVTEANINNRDPVWTLEYNTRDTYGMSDFSPASWSDLADRLYKDNALFEQFLRFHHRVEAGPCNNDCRRGHICGMRSAKSYADQIFCNGL